MNKTTSKKQFEIFKKEGRKWEKLFGLQQWNIIYTQEEDEDNLSYCLADYEAGTAVINLTTVWGLCDSLTEKELKKTAFHELKELLMWKIRRLLEFWVADDIINEEIHHIIRVWENIYFKEEK